MRFGRPNPRSRAGDGIRAGRPQPVDTETPRPDFTPTPRSPLGGATPAGEHSLLSGDVHYDTVEASVVAGDLLYGNSTPLWDRLPIGSSGYVLTVSAGLPAWSDPAHNLLSATHSDTLAASVTRGDLIYGNSTPKWARLALGTSGYVLRSDGTDVAWSADAHNLLSARHGDTTTASATRGDIITAQGASPKWARLAKSATSTHVLKAGASEPAWGQVAFSELSGTLTDAQHGALSASSSHTVGGDISGTTAAATVAKIQGLAVTAPVAGDDGQFLRYNHATGYTWETPSGTAHNLLSVTHSDTTAASATRGDLITAQGASPTWSRLALGVSGRYLRSDGTDAAWTAIAHGDVVFSGLTAGYVWKASGAAAASFAQLLHSELGSVGANDHHNQSHVLATNLALGGDHTISGATSGHVLRASSATAAAFAQLQHADLGGVTADQHHAQAHSVLDSTNHSDTLTGTLVSGDILYVNATPKLTRLPKGSDGQLLKLASGLPSWANPNTVSTSSAGFQGWRRLAISSAATTKGQVPGMDNENTGIGMFRSGTIVGVSVDIGSDLSGSSSDWYETEVYTRTPTSSLTWAASGVLARITGGAGDQVHANGSGSVAFAQGDQITCYDQRQNLGASSIASKVTVFVVFDN